MAEESYSIKEILGEMREENRDSFNKINEHLAKLNGKVATHVQQISELEANKKDIEARLRLVEGNAIKAGVVISIVVFVAIMLANAIGDKLLG